MGFSITEQQVSAFRLSRHHLLKRNERDVEIVCHDVCGIQAQVMSAAELAFRTRIPGLKREDLDSALWQKRTLVKTSCMRQTLHIIPAADFAVFITAIRKTRMEAALRSMSRFSIGERGVGKLNELIVKQLRDGPKPRSQLMPAIEAKAGKGMKEYIGRAWGIQVFRPALVQGLICYGPDRAKKTTFALTEDWLGKQKTVEPEEAQRRVLRWYLAAYGPATPRDFSKWSGNKMPEVKQAWNHLENEIEEVSVEGKQAWIRREDLQQLKQRVMSSETVRLLPYFDCYLLGHAQKEHLVDAAHYKQVYRNQGWISPVVLLNGNVVGVWSHKEKANHVSVEITAFGKFSKKVCEQIEREAANLSDFFNKTYKISYTGEQK